jgi:integrase
MPTTLLRRLASIKKIHRLLRLPHLVDDEEVLLSLRRALRSKSRRRKQAHGLTGDLRDMMIAACPETLLGLRNRALIAVGYDTLCRRSELVALRVEDLCELEGGAMSIFVKRAKTDPFGDGRLSYLTPKTVKILRAWLKASGVTESWIFRRVYSKRIGVSCLHSYTVSRTIKELAAAAGMDQVVATKLSGHSMRVGAAQDMMANGIGILPIMQAGGWQSLNNVARYVAHVSVTQNGIAQLFRRQASNEPTSRMFENMPDHLSKDPRVGPLKSRK